MDKIKILTTCRACGGKAYIPMDEEMSTSGRTYVRHRPCYTCQGSGKEARWIDVQDFAQILKSIVSEAVPE